MEVFVINISVRIWYLGSEAVSGVLGDLREGKTSHLNA